MRASALLPAILLALGACAQEPISHERKAERLFLFADIRGQVLSGGKVMSAFVPMVDRLALQSKYTQNTSAFDFSKTRAEFVRKALAQFTKEELDAVYDFRYSKCVMLIDKQAAARTDVSCITSAFILWMTTGSDDLGDFTIEESPAGLSPDRIELARKVVQAMEIKSDDDHESDIIDKFVKQGMAREQAMEEMKVWDKRLKVGLAHAYALRLSKADLEGLLAGYTDEKLRPLLLREEKLASEILSGCFKQVLEKSLREHKRPK